MLLNDPTTPFSRRMGWKCCIIDAMRTPMPSGSEGRRGDDRHLLSTHNVLEVHTTMCNVLEAAHCNVLEAAHVQDVSRLGGLELQWWGREAKTTMRWQWLQLWHKLERKIYRQRHCWWQCRNCFLHDSFCCSVKCFLIKKSFVKILFFMANMVLEVVKVFS